MSENSPMISAALPAALPADVPAAHVRLWPLVTIAGVLTWAADFLFWKQDFGVNVGIFAALLAVGILLQRPVPQIGRGGWAALALLLGAAVQSGIELCFTNVCVLLTLLLVLGGGTYYATIEPVWRRWLAQLQAALAAPGRLFWLLNSYLAQRPAGRAQNAGEAMSRGLLIFAPAIVLVVVFMALLAQGNMMFNELLTRWGNKTTAWLLAFDWSPWRLVFWLLAAAIALAFLRPRDASSAPAGRALGTWNRPDQRLAWLQCVIALAMLNALFALVNTVGVVEFWSPILARDGMSQKDLVHDGVHHLVAATVLAALVLAGMFQQQPALTKSRTLRGLGHLWIVQNLIMAACVFRRDYLYVLETHLLTEKRIYVMCFLGLVVFGYALLGLHVQRGGRLAWLLRSNVLAAFALFYVIQFCDVSGFASQWCARKTLTEPGWEFDSCYWTTQGAAAWPAILAVAESPVDRPTRTDARIYLTRIRTQQAGLQTDLRAYQWREAKNRAALLATAP
jgi:hypothetical protein